MESWVYFALWAAVIVLMMRFGCGAHLLGHGGHGRRGGASSPTEELRSGPPETDIDPVCGKTVATAKAKPSLHGATVYYFCSRECRDVFEAAPDHYIGSPPRLEHRQMEHSHD